jgi:hypothetical protein
MATLLTSLQLSSSDATTDTLAIGVSKTLTVNEPITGLSRSSIATGSATNLLTTSDTDDTYVYLKNIDATNFIEGKDDAGNTIIKLSAGEIAFFCVKGAVGFEVQADTGACILEYGLWSKT